MAPAEKALEFEKNGVTIVAQIWHGRAAEVSYFRIRNFTALEIESLLDGNASGWKIIGGTAQSPVWATVGLGAAYIPDINILSLMTDEFQAAYKAAAAFRVKGL